MSLKKIWMSPPFKSNFSKKEIQLLSKKPKYTHVFDPPEELWDLDNEELEEIAEIFVLMGDTQFLIDILRESSFQVNYGPSWNSLELLKCSCVNNLTPAQCAEILCLFKISDLPCDDSRGEYFYEFLSRILRNNLDNAFPIAVDFMMEPSFPNRYTAESEEYDLLIECFLQRVYEDGRFVEEYEKLMVDLLMRHKKYNAGVISDVVRHFEKNPKLMNKKIVTTVRTCYIENKVSDGHFDDFLLRTEMLTRKTAKLWVKDQMVQKCFHCELPRVLCEKELKKKRSAELTKWETLSVEYFKKEDWRRALKMMLRVLDMRDSLLSLRKTPSIFNKYCAEIYTKFNQKVLASIYMNKWRSHCAAKRAKEIAQPGGGRVDIPPHQEEAGLGVDMVAWSSGSQEESRMKVTSCNILKTHSTKFVSIYRDHREGCLLPNHSHFQVPCCFSKGKNEFIYAKTNRSLRRHNIKTGDVVSYKTPPGVEAISKIVCGAKYMAYVDWKIFKVVVQNLADGAIVLEYSVPGELLSRHRPFLCDIDEERNCLVCGSAGVLLVFANFLKDKHPSAVFWGSFLSVNLFDNQLYTYTSDRDFFTVSNFRAHYLKRYAIDKCVDESKGDCFNLPNMVYLMYMGSQEQSGFDFARDNKLHFYKDKVVIVGLSLLIFERDTGKMVRRIKDVANLLSTNTTERSSVYSSGVAVKSCAFWNSFCVFALWPSGIYLVDIDSGSLVYTLDPTQGRNNFRVLLTAHEKRKNAYYVYSVSEKNEKMIGTQVLVQCEKRASMCSYCRKRNTNLKKCARCKRAKYCGKICQKNHWKIHKKVCGRLHR